MAGRGKGRGGRGGGDAAPVCGGGDVNKNAGVRLLDCVVLLLALSWMDRPVMI